MAFRHRQRSVQDGDIIDAEDWNENLRELTGEFNGFLDRDNLRERAIQTKHVNDNAFHEIYTDQSDQTFSFGSYTFGYFGGDASGSNGINLLEFEADVDGMVICEWSGEWSFGNDKFNDENKTRPQHNKVVTYRLMVNGVEVAKIYRNPDLHVFGSGYMVGAFPVAPGNVRVSVEGKQLHIDNETGDITTDGFNVSVRNRVLLVTYKRR